MGTRVAVYNDDSMRELAEGVYRPLFFGIRLPEPSSYLDDDLDDLLGHVAEQDDSPF